MQYIIYCEWIKDNISYISRDDFEKYICHRGNICLYKDSRTNKIEDEKPMKIVILLILHMKKKCIIKFKVYWQCHLC